MHTFKLKILTPDQKLFEGEVVSFTIPTQSGEITVLKDHAPLITLISIGEIKVKEVNPLTQGFGETRKFLVQGGVVDVKSVAPEFEVVILADQVVDTTADNLDAEIARAKEAMKLNADEIDFALEEATIERNVFLKRFKSR